MRTAASRGVLAAVSAMLVMLSVGGVAAQEESAPASSAGGGSCAWTDPATGNHYDLSEMQHGKDFEKTVQMGLAIKFVYQFNVCGNTFAPCSNKVGASIETLQLSSGRNCRVLGKLPMSWEALNVPASAHNPHGEGVTIKYEDGDICDPISRSKRSTIIHVECSTLESGPGTLVDMKKDQNCVTKFRIMSAAGCAKRGVSHGTVFLIVLVVVLVLYLAAGMFWGYRQGHRGKEMLPHREHWSALPLLVKDGALFVATKVRGCARK